MTFRLLGFSSRTATLRLCHLQIMRMMMMQMRKKLLLNLHSKSNNCCHSMRCRTASWIVKVTISCPSSSTSASRAETLPIELAIMQNCWFSTLLTSIVFNFTLQKDILKGLLPQVTSSTCREEEEPLQLPVISQTAPEIRQIWGMIENFLQLSIKIIAFNSFKCRPPPSLSSSSIHVLCRWI